MGSVKMSRRVFVCLSVLSLLVLRADMKSVNFVRAKRFMMGNMVRATISNDRDTLFPISRMMSELPTAEIALRQRKPDPAFSLRLNKDRNSVSINLPKTNNVQFHKTETKRNDVNRSDKFSIGGEVIAREHAKLVQDINALLELNPGWSRLAREETTTVYRDDARDDSIYTEDLETRVSSPSSIVVSTSEFVPTRAPTVNLKIIPGVTPKPIALPIVVLGNPAKLTSKTIVTKPPYPFVGSASTTRPVRMPSLFSYASYLQQMRPKQTLWEKFLSIFPRLIR